MHTGVEWSDRDLVKSCVLRGMDEFAVFSAIQKAASLKKHIWGGELMVLFNQLAFD